MLRSSLAVATILAAALSSLGCGEGTNPAQPSKSSEAAQALSSKDQLKERLKMIAESGSGGSAVSGMRAGIEQLKSTEEALAKDLLKDVETLEKMTDPAKIKVQAFKMLDKLSK